MTLSKKNANASKRQAADDMDRRQCYEEGGGDGPVVLGFPHTGTWLPSDLERRLNETGRAIADTDWRIHDLYDGLLPSARWARALFHRYWVDANRPPSGESLYPGQATTELCPTTTFDGEPIYAKGFEPDAKAVDERRWWHRRYHQALNRAIEGALDQHGVAILFDCHSIRSNVPRLFAGELPHLNIGDFDGESCDPRVTALVEKICREGSSYETVVNGRFKGGWTTRHYGKPKKNVHAIQLEIAQRSYMDEYPPWRYDPGRAGNLRKKLKMILQALDALARSGDLLEKGAR